MPHKLNKLSALPAYLLPFCLAVLLASCASTHNLESDAKIIKADSLQATNSLKGFDLSQAAWPNQQWWHLLHNPQLNRLIKQALAHNPRLTIARAHIKQAAALAGIEHAKNLPTANINGTLSGAQLPKSIVPSPLSDDFNWMKILRLNFVWDPDIWGGDRAAWQAAVGKVHAAKIAKQATQLLVRSHVILAYADLGYAFRQHDLAKEELQRSQQALDLTKQRVRAGIDNQMQLERANAEVARAQQNLAAANFRITQVRILLATLIGAGPDRGLDIKRPTATPFSHIDLPTNLSANLLGHRPDIVAARWRVEAASKQIEAAKTRFLPNISISAMAGLIAEGSSALFNTSSTRFYTVAPAISLPIFEGGKLRSNLKQKNAAYDLAVAHYNQTLIKAVNDVTRLARQVRSLKTQQHYQQQVLESLRSAWKLSRKRYKAGVGSFLEALDVRRNLLRAEQNHIALNARRVEMSIRLIAALGGGFHTQDTQSKTSSSRPTTDEAHHG